MAVDAVLEHDRSEKRMSYGIRPPPLNPQAVSPMAAGPSPPMPSSAMVPPRQPTLHPGRASSNSLWNTRMLNAFSHGSPTHSIEISSHESQGRYGPQSL